MVKKHLKRISTPKTWQIDRKKETWIARPKPGAHPLEYGMPLCTILTEIIKCAKTRGEINKLLHNGKILVDGRKGKEPRQPVGLMDVIKIPDTKEQFRILLNNKGKLVAAKIDDKESEIKLSKIENKTLIKGGKVQLNLSDGRNITIDKDSYSTGDVVVLTIPDQTIKDHLKFEKDVSAYLTGGKHIGEHGIIEDIKGNTILFKATSGERYETLKEFAFVIGKDKPIITLPE